MPHPPFEPPPIFSCPVLFVSFVGVVNRQVAAIPLSTRGEVTVRLQWREYRLRIEDVDGTLQVTTPNHKDIIGEIVVPERGPRKHRNMKGHGYVNWKQRPRSSWQGLHDASQRARESWRHFERTFMVIPEVVSVEDAD